MNEELISLLRDLAMQLGTTSAQLWYVLVSGVTTEAIVTVAVSSIVLPTGSSLRHPRERELAIFL